MRGLGAFVLLCLCALQVVWVAGGRVEAAQGEVVKPIVRTPNCTEGQCHATQRQYKFVHGPTAIGACDTCHAYADEKQHTFTLKRADQELCGFCHVGKIQGQVVHKPVMDGQCLGCHNPHGAGNRSMLRKDDMGQLCAQCHGDVTKKRSHVHGPVASGSCAACHNSHRSQYPKLLVAQGKELCLGCHDQMRLQLQQAKAVHKPLEGDCQQCHEAHASNEIMQLKQAPLALCTGCHDDVNKLASTATHKHSAVTSGAACLNCHTPHGGNLTKLMKGEPTKVCLSCHNKKIDAPDGRTVASVAEMADPAAYKHGPIKDGNCMGCHNSHGSSESRLLTKAYPTTFYESFETDKYALCFTCHDKQLVLLEKTQGLTNFRNGEENLHYLHVNKSDRGRSCRACHETHASKHPMHIRESVPYGSWQLPINYKPTATGGSCAPGCHKETSYDRAKPVGRETGTAAALPATAPIEESKP